MDDMLDLAGLAWMLTARNGASGELTARIWADADGKQRRSMGQQGCCPIIKTIEWRWGYQGNPSHL